MEVCEDNSTACLLRKIHEDALEFNWDPLSFAFTVAIGALAFIVACITVFQGLLAAGPGRIKASRRAIGEWSEFSRSRFDYTELRVRSTALVPFIQIFPDTGDLPRTLDWGSKSTGRYADVLGLLGDAQKSQRRKEKMKAIWKRGLSRFHFLSGQPAVNTEGEGSIGSILPSSNSYAASWANLLARLPGSRNYFTAQGPEKKELPKAILCETNYLPGDVAAAVAAGTIQSIITIAAFVGCDEIDQSNLLPEARGNNIQLSFREHPLLGTVAVAQEFPMRDTYRADFSCDILTPELMFGHSIYMRPSFLGLRYSMYNLYCGSPPWLRAVTFDSMNYAAVAKHICALAAPWKNLDARAVICAIIRHVEHRNGILFYNHTLLPHVFEYAFPNKTAPYSSDRNSGDISMPIIDGSCYQGSPLWIDRSLISPFARLFEPDEAMIDGFEVKISNITPVYGRLLHTLPELAEISSRKEDLDTFDLQICSGKYLSGRRRKPAQDKPTLILLPLALRCCLDFLEEKFSFQELSFESKASTRGALRHQLHEIDHWLLRYDRLAAWEACKAHVLKVMDEEPDLTKVALKRQEQKSMQETMDKTEDAVTLPTLLAFRAVLMATFMSTAADISCVTNTALGRRVVQFL